MAARRYRTQGDGRWFPGDARTLMTMVEAFITQAADPGVSAGTVAAVIAPHAGYVYSGTVAGHAYRAVRDAAGRGEGPETVVVLGFSHRVPFRGVAWLDADVIQTPAGDLNVDTERLALLTACVPGSFPDTRLHAGEHSAENQFPFIQAAVPGVPVVAGLIGGHDSDQCAALDGALSCIAATRRLTVIASTDLLHDTDGDRVLRSDQRTLAMMERLDSDGLNKAWSWTEQICCGIAPVLAAIAIARSQGCVRGRVAAYSNSGTSEPRRQDCWVVGYGAVVYECA